MSSPTEPPQGASEPAPEPDPLDLYRDKRGPGTPEPAGVRPASGRPTSGGVFVVHEHHATRTHWDLRLEMDGVLVSWAVPNRPSMSPEDKRLAVKVEAHPLEYCDFEAVIPAGHYGAGPMIVWDRGRFVPKIEPRQGVRDGEVKFELFGYKLRGEFTLVRTGGRGARGQVAKGGDQWLLIKKRDQWSEAFAASGEPLSSVSVLSGLTAVELADSAPRMLSWRAQVAVVGAPQQTIANVGFRPMVCETAERPFSSEQWIFELKYDGYRLIGWGGAGQALLRYRSGQDATARFPEIAAGLRAIPVPDLVIDGEVCVLDPEGKPDFHKLAERAQLSRKSDIAFGAVAAPVVWYVFDLLGADGFDLRGVEVERRKALLAGVVPPVGAMRYADHIPAVGEAFLAEVVRRGLEGVVAKKLGSRYRAGIRTRDWLKVKMVPEGDFAVCGFTAPKASRAGLGALHLCVRVDGSWRYAGKVGSGFDDATLLALRTELDEALGWVPTFPVPEGSLTTGWVEPSIVVVVRYTEWTPDLVLRHPVFLRRRDDKPAIECVGPTSRSGPLSEPPTAEPVVDDEDRTRTLHLSNLKKVFWPADGYTKGDLIDYYRSIAPWILPYLVDRPVVITRYPDGIDGKWFYQKDMPDWLPPWLRTMTRWSEHSQREIHYVVVDDADGLAYLANLGSIPIHVWASRTVDLDRPDWSIIDLDPKNAPREHVVPLALAIHELCDACGLPNFVKTSGQTGLHVLIPMAGQCNYEQARNLAYLLGMVIEGRFPDMATTLRNPEKRRGRVYLDWGQNAHGQLLVAPLSVRPVPGARVSMPLEWHEVIPGLDPGAFTIKNARARLEGMTDPVRPVLTSVPDLLGALGRLQELLAVQAG